VGVLVLLFKYFSIIYKGIRRESAAFPFLTPILFLNPLSQCLIRFTRPSTQVFPRSLNWSLSSLGEGSLKYSIFSRRRGTVRGGREETLSLPSPLDLIKAYFPLTPCRPALLSSGMWCLRRLASSTHPPFGPQPTRPSSFHTNSLVSTPLIESP